MNIVEASVKLGSLGYAHTLVIASSPTVIRDYETGSVVRDITHTVRLVSDILICLKHAERELEKRLYVEFTGRKYVINKAGNGLDDATTRILNNRDNSNSSNAAKSFGLGGH